MCGGACEVFCAVCVFCEPTLLRSLETICYVLPLHSHHHHWQMERLSDDEGPAEDAIAVDTVAAVNASSSWFEETLSVDLLSDRQVPVLQGPAACESQTPLHCTPWKPLRQLDFSTCSGWWSPRYRFSGRP